MGKTVRIGVFCGSSSGEGSVYMDAARELGRWIGEKGYSLVYGGGDAGLMGAVASEVHAAGNEVIGIVPGNIGFIKDREQPYVTELITTEDMSSRKKKMFELSDVFIALPGGIGTLDELSEAITLTKIGVFNKPCILFNRNGFYEPLREMLGKMETAGFFEKGSISYVMFSDEEEKIGEFIGKYI